MTPSAQVTVRILDRDYHVACPPEERESLLKAADLLNQQMSEVRDSGRVVGMDRIAVMVALNLAHQYLEAEQERDVTINESLRRIQHMRLTLAQGGDGKAATA